MPKITKQKFKYLENEKRAFFIIFEGLPLKEISKKILEGESPTLKSAFVYLLSKISNNKH